MTDNIQVNQPQSFAQSRGKTPKKSFKSSKRPGTSSSAEPKPSTSSLTQLELFKSLNESRFKEIQTLNAKLSRAQEALKKANAETLTFKKQLAIAEKTIQQLNQAAAQPKKQGNKRPATQSKSTNPSRPTTATNKVITIPASKPTTAKQQVKPTSAVKSVKKTEIAVENKNNTKIESAQQPAKKAEAKKEVAASKPTSAASTSSKKEAPKQQVKQQEPASKKSNNKTIDAKSTPKAVKRLSNSSPIDNTPPVWTDYIVPDSEQKQSKAKPAAKPQSVPVAAAKEVPKARVLVVKPQATPVVAKDQPKTSKPQTPVAKPQVQAKEKKENTNSKPSTAASSSSANKERKPSLGGGKKSELKEPGNIAKPTTTGNKRKGKAGKK